MTEMIEKTVGEDGEDLTELSLRNWGLSGQPVNWAWSSWQPVVSMIRAVNTGFADASVVQTGLDTVFPGMGYQAANVCLAHAPTAEFVIAPGDIDPEVDPGAYLDVIRVDLVSDEDLDLPNDQVAWDFGDGTPVEHDAFGYEHGYRDAGTYTVSCTIPVAGVLFTTSQEYTVDGDVATPATNPAYEERPATDFGEDEPEAYDPGEHTVVEVLEYAKAHPGEVDAIRDAEYDGKNRSGIVDHL